MVGRSLLALSAVSCLFSWPLLPQPSMAGCFLGITGGAQAHLARLCLVWLWWAGGLVCFPSLGSWASSLPGSSAATAVQTAHIPQCFQVGLLVSNSEHLSFPLGSSPEAPQRPPSLEQLQGPSSELRSFSLWHSSRTLFCPHCEGAA